MIIKSYEIKKINLENSQFVLFYGHNQGLKKKQLIILIKKIRFPIMMKKKF